MYYTYRSRHDVDRPHCLTLLLYVTEYITNSMRSVTVSLVKPYKWNILIIHTRMIFVYGVTRYCVELFVMYVRPCARMRRACSGRNWYVSECIQPGDMHIACRCILPPPAPTPHRPHLTRNPGSYLQLHIQLII